MTNIKKHKYIEDKKKLHDAYRDGCDNLHLINYLNEIAVSPYIELVQYCIEQLKINDPYVLIKIDDSNFDEDMYHQLLSRILAYKNLGVRKFEFVFMRNNKLDIPAMKYIIDAVEDCEFGSMIEFNDNIDINDTIDKLVELGSNWVILKSSSLYFNQIRDIKTKYKNLNLIICNDEKINASDIWFETGVNEIIE